MLVLAVPGGTDIGMGSAGDFAASVQQELVTRLQVQVWKHLDSFHLCLRHIYMQASPIYPNIISMQLLCLPYEHAWQCTTRVYVNQLRGCRH